MSLPDFYAPDATSPLERRVELSRELGDLRRAIHEMRVREAECLGDLIMCNAVIREMHLDTSALEAEIHTNPWADPEPPTLQVVE